MSTYSKAMVYRYLNQQFGLLALQQRKWKIGRLLELNDPLDCQPVLRNSDGSLGLSGAHPSLTDIYEKIGIICYSKSISDPVIWSHYADSHRGMAFGFDYPQTGAGTLFEVNYPSSDSRVILDYNELDEQIQKENTDASLSIISKGFIQKAKSWAYECEYRHFIYLHGCTMEGPHYFRCMPIEHLRRIILGVRCQITKSDIQRIIQPWPQHYPMLNDIEIVKAEIDPQTYAIKV